MTFGRRPAKPRLRRPNIVWSGTRCSCPSSRNRLAVKPSAWRRARWKTSRSISTNSIAASEYRAWPPGVVRRGACHLARAASSSQRGRVTAPLQASLVGRPVLDPIAGLRDAVTARGIVLERHARDRNGSAATGPPAPAPGGSLHQRPLPGEKSGGLLQDVPLLPKDLVLPPQPLQLRREIALCRCGVNSAPIPAPADPADQR